MAACARKPCCSDYPAPLGRIGIWAPGRGWSRASSAAGEEASDAGEERVDLVHEALLTRWELMRGWLADAGTRRQLEAEDALEEAARFWERDGAPEQPGLPEARMLERYFQANAPSALARRYLAALERERSQLEAARLAREAKEQEARRRRRRRRLWLGGGTLACLLGGFAVLDGWAAVNGASRSLAVKALATRWRLAVPPPIPEMVEIPPDRFWMGAADDDPAARDTEKPRHAVEIKRAFRLGRFEVTFAEYDAFADAATTGESAARTGTISSGREDRRWGRERRPVIGVSWEDATCYAEWLSQHDGPELPVAERGGVAIRRARRSGHELLVGWRHPAGRQGLGEL